MLDRFDSWFKLFARYDVEETEESIGYCPSVWKKWLATVRGFWFPARPSSFWRRSCQGPSPSAKSWALSFALIDGLCTQLDAQRCHACHDPSMPCCFCQEAWEVVIQRFVLWTDINFQIWTNGLDLQISYYIYIYIYIYTYVYIIRYHMIQGLSQLQFGGGRQHGAAGGTTAPCGGALCWVDAGSSLRAAGRSQRYQGVGIALRGHGRLLFVGTKDLLILWLKRDYVYTIYIYI